MPTGRYDELKRGCYLPDIIKYKIFICVCVVISCDVMCAAENGAFWILNSAVPAHTREYSQKNILKKLGNRIENK